MHANKNGDIFGTRHVDGGGTPGIPRLKCHRKANMPVQRGRSIRDSVKISTKENSKKNTKKTHNQKQMAIIPPAMRAKLRKYSKQSEQHILLLRAQHLKNQSNEARRRPA